jgi:hypothetical protein
MSWPGSTISTNNLDSSGDKPADARSDLYDAVVAVNNIINSRAVANGIASLDATGTVPDSQIPDTISSDLGNDITFTPSSSRTTLFYILGLQARSNAQLANISGIVGDVAYCSDGDSGNACIAVYNTTGWKRVAFGANISAS